MRFMLASWNLQVLPTNLTLSVSWALPVAALVTNELENLRVKYPRLEVLSQSEPLAQFQHYELLAQHWYDGGVPPATFVLFSDADDIWHPQRTRSYSEMIRYGLSRTPPNKKLTYICYRDVVRALDAADAIRTAADVNSAIKSRRFVASKAIDEHWTTAVPLQLLRIFIAEAPSELLRHKFADVFFNRFVRAFGGSTGGSIGINLTNGDDGEWRYFYRTRDNTNARRIDSSMYHNLAGFDTVVNRAIKKWSHPAAETKTVVAVHASNYVLALAEGLGASDERLREWSARFIPVETHVFLTVAKWLHQDVDWFRQLFAWQHSTTPRALDAW